MVIGAAGHLGLPVVRHVTTEINNGVANAMIHRLRMLGTSAMGILKNREGV